jgi:hypothetical protein
MRVSDTADRVSQPIESILIELMLHDGSQVAPRWYVRSSGLTQKEWWTIPGAVVADPTFSRDFQEARGWWEESLLYRPRTELGRRLWAIRQRFLSSGARPLTAEEIAHELAVRRGERSGE